MTGITIPVGGGGSGYASPPAVTLIGGGGSGTGFISATAVATVSGGVGHRDHDHHSRLGLSHGADGPDRLSDSAVAGPGHL